MTEPQKMATGWIGTLGAQAARIATDTGFDQRELPFPTFIALVMTELAEALECHRDGMMEQAFFYNQGKPEGIASELADVLIRVTQFCVVRGIPIERAIEEKMIYNASRPFRHGGKQY